jgi:hypothetical protein
MRPQGDEQGSDAHVTSSGVATGGDVVQATPTVEST